ncbi:hypothetical protein V8E36_008327 [Tilletia maclaganii]
MSSRARPSFCPRIRHLVTGTFNTASLHLLAFDTLAHTLTLTNTIDAQGPHQFLALGTGGVGRLDGGSSSSSGSSPWKTIYATTWASPPSLSSWAVTGLDEEAGASLEASSQVSLDWLSTVPITATSSYVHVQPPPFSSLTAPSYNVAPGPAGYLYSAGGPTGEVHLLDPGSGAIMQGPGAQLQELIFLAGGETALGTADKSRKALRNGAHNIDVSVDHLAFVADLGRNAILTYRREYDTGRLDLLSETPSPREGDGPRHVVPTPEGDFLLSVTEHTSFVDVFALTDKYQGKVEYMLSLDILPEGADRTTFRGDTVRLSPSGRSIFATTRGKTPATQGWIAAWDFDRVRSRCRSSLPDRILREKEQTGDVDDTLLLHRWRTPTSGGKANAIEWAPRYNDPSFSAQTPGISVVAEQTTDDDWAVLTDDAEGLILIYHWDGRDLVEVAQTRLPGRGDSQLGEGDGEGASHAIWLS